MQKKYFNFQPKGMNTNMSPKFQSNEYATYMKNIRITKDDNGVLKKQIVQSGGNVNSGYSVLIKGGITREDKIAFPYSSSAKSGVKTREGTLEELYGY